MKQKTIIIALTMVITAIAVPILMSDSITEGATTYSVEQGASGETVSSIDPNRPYYVITKADGSVTYHQAPVLTQTINLNNNENTNKSYRYYILETTRFSGQYSNATITILDRANWQGASIDIVVPEGQILYGYGGATMGSSTDFSNRFSSISISGSGEFSSVIPNMAYNNQSEVKDYTGLTGLGFNGVPTVLEDVTITTSGIYGGSSYETSALESTSLVIDNASFTGQTIFAGSKDADAGSTSITVNGLRHDVDSTLYIYGGNQSGGNVGTTDVVVTGCEVQKNIQIIAGGSGSSACEETNVTVTGLNAGGDSYVIGGGNHRSHVGTTNVNIGGDANISAVYGGGGNGGRVGSANVNIMGGTIGAVYAGGQYQDQNRPGTTGTSTVNVSGGTIGIPGVDRRALYLSGTNGATLDSVLAVISGGTISSIEYVHETSGKLTSADSAKVEYNGSVRHNPDGSITVSQTVPPIWMDDEEDDYYGQTVTGSSGSDDSTTVVACAAAAVVAALMAAFLIIDRKP